MGLKHMKKCIELSKKYNKVNFDDFFTLAVAEHAQKDYEGFLQSAQTFMDFYEGEQQLEKKYSISLMMCDTHYKQNNIPLAEKSFGSLIKIASSLYGENSSEILESYMYRVDLLSEQGETAKSYYRTALTEAINISKSCDNLDPKNMVNLFLRAGESYANDEEWGQALEYIEKVHKLSPEKYLAQEGDQLEQLYHLTAKTYHSLGRSQEGLIYAEKAKALGSQQ